MTVTAAAHDLWTARQRLREPATRKLALADLCAGHPTQRGAPGERARGGNDSPARGGDRRGGERRAFGRDFVMPLHQDMLALSRVVRPKILALAREGRLVETCFQEFQEKVYPGAPDVQINAMRTSFFAGVAELFAMQIYASDTETDEPTDDDFALFSNIDDEVRRFHAQVIEATKATGKPS